RVEGRQQSHVLRVARRVVDTGPGSILAARRVAQRPVALARAFVTGTILHGVRRVAASAVAVAGAFVARTRRILADRSVAQRPVALARGFETSLRPIRGERRAAPGGVGHPAAEAGPGHEVLDGRGAVGRLVAAR